MFVFTTVFLQAWFSRFSVIVDRNMLDKDKYFRKKNFVRKHFLLQKIILKFSYSPNYQPEVALDETFHTTLPAQKWSFPLRISSVNVTKSAVSCAVRKHQEEYIRKVPVSSDITEAVQ